MKKIYLMLFCTMFLLSGCSAPHDNLSEDANVSAQAEEMLATKSLLAGPAGLLPSYLENFCDVEVEKENLRPVKLSYDFSELKPYVLSEGALSGEYALDTDLMYMIYEFDYELDHTIAVPDEFIP